MHPIVVIPTYNEKENVAQMASAVLEQLPPEGEVLFLDDNSPDGTGAILDALHAREPRIGVMHRAKKEGLGRAYVAGFAEALARGATHVIEMDCDFSHDPHDIPRLLSALSAQHSTANAQHSTPNAHQPKTNDQRPKTNDQRPTTNDHDAPDVVIGSRYVKGGKCVGWPLKRWLLSFFGGRFIRFVLGVPVQDPTGGFKCFTREALEKLGDFSLIRSFGYSFQMEMNYRMAQLGLTLREIPITFTERRAGTSKITGSIAAETLKMVFKLRLGK